MREKSRAGSRVSRFGRIDPSRVAWLKTRTTNMLSIISDDEESINEKYGEHAAGEPGDSVVLCIYVPGRGRPLVWDITGMTGEELDATRKFFDHLFDLADPVVRERDKVAQDALEKGDDSYARVYREVPTFVTRKRQERANSEGVQQRPSDDSRQHGGSGGL